MTVFRFFSAAVQPVYCRLAAINQQLKPVATRPLYTATKFEAGSSLLNSSPALLVSPALILTLTESELKPTGARRGDARALLIVLLPADTFTSAG